MKLKLSPLYILCFLALTFFVQEVHDWAQTLTAWLTTGCWGPRGFGSWAFCQENAPFGKRVLAIVAGPLVSYTVLWSGLQRMNADEENAVEHSIGVSMVFAALPLNSLLAAFRGEGDVTTALRFLFPHGAHRSLSMVGLLIVAMVCIPPILKAFVVLPWWMGKLFFFPVFLVVPGILDQWFVGRMLNRWLIPGGAASASAYWWVGGWTLLTMTVWLLTRRRLRTLISDEELPL